MSSSQPVNQYNEPALSDDPAILPEDRLLRVIKTSRHIIPLDGNRFAVSPQLFSTKGKGCSTELERLFVAANETIGGRIAAGNGLGGAILGVAKVRGTFSRVNGSEALGVAYTPIPDGEPFGPNPYHCDIIPKLGMPGTRGLADAATIADLDEERVRREHAERHGSVSD